MIFDGPMYTRSTCRKRDLNLYCWCKSGRIHDEHKETSGLENTNSARSEVMRRRSQEWRLIARCETAHVASLSYGQMTARLRPQPSASIFTKDVPISPPRHAFDPGTSLPTIEVDGTTTLSFTSMIQRREHCSC